MAIITRAHLAMVRVIQDPDFIRRFLSKIKPAPLDECWLWTGAPGPCGYGVLGAGGKGAPNLYAHRISFALRHGIPPVGMDICHTCDNPPCVNPNHLFLGTRKDNLLDMVKKDRHSRGERCHYHRLVDAEVIEIRRLRSDGMTLRLIAEKFDVAQTTISAVIRGQTWRHLL